MTEQEKQTVCANIYRATETEVRRVKNLKDADLPATPDAIRAKIVSELEGLGRNMTPAVLYYELVTETV